MYFVIEIIDEHWSPRTAADEPMVFKKFISLIHYRLTRATLDN